MNMPRLLSLLALCALAGCVQPATVPVPQAPAAPAAPAAPRVVTPAVPAAPPVAAPAAPAAPTGPVDSRTGLHQASLISVSGDADSRFTVLFRPAQTEAARIDAAPAQLCRQAGRGLEDSRTNKPGAGSAMPGVQMMIVTCSAA
ncbi:hypothetical protein [Paracoccus benzoatiresistens]|uniref:Uncharacterized protein n=1 Tax=Paracoccus benzoatiresistens TaxID=2997341 RepID=A0ABT4J4X0_9RHOB|nr:hypothetical protein [Paracoccus sp. EF6]MCZ0962164.1 hypothetical protein [Paracoccus sp. EF6]